MKRNISEVRQDPSALFPRDVHGVRSFKCRPVPQENQACEPKMSEYAFFTKLKEDAGNRFCSHPQDRDKHQPKKLKTSCNSGAKSHTLHNRHKKFNSLLLPEKATHVNSFQFLSPLGNASKKSEVNLKNIFAASEDVHNVPKITDNCGARYRQLDVFSKKRKNLHQWVANSSSSDELCPKGCDIISPLISRLFPVTIMEKTGKGQIDGKTKVHAFPLSKNYSNESHQMPTGNIMETDHKLALENGLCFCWMDIRKEPNISSSSSSILHETYEDGRMTGLELLRESKSHSFYAEDNSTVGFQIPEYEPDTCSDLKGINRFHDRNKCFGGDELHLPQVNWEYNMVGERKLSLTSRTSEWSIYPYQKQKQNSMIGDFHSPNNPVSLEEFHLPLLGWESKDMLDDRNLSLGYENKELSMCPNSWGLRADDQQIENFSRFSVNELCRASCLSHHSPNLPSLCWDPSPGYDSHDLGRGIIERKKNVDTVLNDWSSSLQDKASDFSTCDKRSIFLSPPNHLWFMNKIVDDKHKIVDDEHSHPDTKVLFSSGIDLNFALRHSPVSNSSRGYYVANHHTLARPNSIDACSSLLIEDKHEHSLCDLEPAVYHCYHEDNMTKIHDWQFFPSSLCIEKELACSFVLDESYLEGY